MKVNLQMVLEYLGQPEQIKGNKLMWACPNCENSDNAYLKYDVAKKYFDCPCKTHSLAIREEIIEHRKIDLAHKKYFGDGK